MAPPETADEPPRPCSSVYSDHFALQDLVYQVDDSVRVAQLNTIEQLLRENLILEKEVEQCRQILDALMDMFDEGFDMALLLRCSLEECEEKISAAQADWLASWGIEAAEVDTWI